MDGREMGACEATARALVATLGELSASQAVTAAQALTIAAMLDIERDGSKASALSRQLTQLTARLVPQAGAGRSPGDAVSRLQDQLAKKRAERERAG